MISALIMGSPVRRLINPITRCWDQPHNRYAGTDDGPGTGRKLDTKQLAHERSRSLAERTVAVIRRLVHSLGRDDGVDLDLDQHLRVDRFTSQQRVGRTHLREDVAVGAGDRL